MKRIELTKGLFAIVDDDIHEYLENFKWHAIKINRESFYATRWVTIDGRQKYCRLHHAVIGFPLNGNRVDHINGDTLDNRRSNLRLSTPSQNSMNRSKAPNNTSGYKGVHFHKGVNKWVAELTVKYKKFHLGVFDTKVDAARAYDLRAFKEFGEFAQFNFKVLEGK